MKTLALIAVLSGFVALTADGDNLIPNPGFEIAGKKGMPAGWTGNFYGANKKGVIKLNNKETHSGKTAITISGFEQGVTGQFMHTPVKATPGVIYKFDVWYKSQAPMKAQLRWFEANGKTPAGLHVMEAPPTNGKWRNYGAVKAIAAFARAKDGKMVYRFRKVSTRGFAAPAKAKKMQLVFFVKNMGSVSFDDVSLQQSSQSAAKDSELQRLLIGSNKKIVRAKEQLIPDIQDVKLSVNYQMTKEKYPASATNIRSRDGIFYRDKTPAFLFGVESSPIAYPWQFRLLGIDIIHMGSTYELGVIRAKKQGKKLKIWWQEYKWAEVVARELLKNGLAVYIQPVETSKLKYHPVAKYFPDAFADTSHFLTYRFGHPLGDRLRENYIKCFIKTFRKYPITMWELFNEVRYTDYSPLNIKNFRITMKNQYGTIKQANKAWKTNFKSFTVVNPPRKSDSHGSRINIKPKNFSQALWADWGIFIEKAFGKSLQDVAAIYRKYEKNPNTYLTVQSYCDLPMGFSSLGGVNPYDKYKAEDVYSHEDRGSIFYRQQAGVENVEEIKAMLINPFVWNFLRKVSPDKPLLGVECHVQGGAPKKTDKPSLINLHGEWKFMVDNAKTGLRKGFAKPKYNDANWKSIKVPGLWGTQGFAKCQFGWYRKKFFIPSSLKGVKLFLNGCQLSDQAQIYLNGKLIRETKNWKDQFADEISENLKYGKENTLAININNNYLSGNMYWGGIRKYISIDRNGFGKVYPLTAGQMRWWMWNRMLYGFSGVIMSYAYSSDASRLSMFRPNKNSFSSIRALPKIKQEIASVASVVMPRPRLKGKVAIVYPLDYGRYSVQKTPGEWISAPLLKNLLNWYSGVLFSQVEIDVISCREIVEGKLKDYKLLMMPIAPLTPNAADVKVKEFIRNGGVLIASPETMTMSSDNYAKKSNAWLFAKNIGKGKVYKTKAVPSFEETAKIVKNILKQTGILPEVAVAGKGKTKYIETHLNGHNGRYVCTVFNWGGGSGKVKLHLNSLPKGRYHARALPDGKKLADVNDGTISTSLKSHQPIILLLEKASLKPLSIKQISAKQQQLVNLWGPSRQGGTPVLLSSGMNEIIGRSRILTAMNLLEHNKYSFDLGLGRFKIDMKVFTDREEVKKLDSFKIVVTMGSGLGGERVFKPTEAALMREYVKNGGSMLIAPNHFVGPHGWLSNSSKNPLLKVFGVTAFNRNIHDTKNYDFVPDYPTFTNITTHPVTSGVKKFQSHGMPVMKVNNPKAKVLIHAANGSPVLIALEYGKGRVVIVGDGKWLQPLPLAKADNARLLLNIFNWLAHRSPAKISDKKLKQEVDCKF
jgi:beta-galactosidase GanA